MRKAQFAAVFALTLLGLVGGSLILSTDGFYTSSKRANWSIFVPAPQAYVMAAIMFALSLVGMLWLLQETQARPLSYFLSFAGYCAALLLLVNALATHLH